MLNKKILVCEIEDNDSYKTPGILYSKKDFANKFPKLSNKIFNESFIKFEIDYEESGYDLDFYIGAGKEIGLNFDSTKIHRLKEFMGFKHIYLFVLISQNEREPGVLYCELCSINVLEEYLYLRKHPKAEMILDKHRKQYGRKA